MTVARVDRLAVVVGTNPFHASVPLGDWHMARALSDAGVFVLYVDPPASPLAALRGKAAPAMLTSAPRVMGERLMIATPVVPSGRVDPRVARVADVLSARQMNRWTAALGAPEPVVLTFAPERGPLTRVRRRMLAYWQKDRNWAADGAPWPGWVRARHEQLLRSADVVFGVSPAIVDDARVQGIDARLVPNGCDVGHFARPRPEPVELHDIPRPRVVFTGSWGSRVDIAGFDNLVRHNPDVSFVLVGPVRAHVPSAPNMYAIGPRPYADLPAHLQHCDVGLVPYAATPFNEASCPLKLYEYLASGLPVAVSGLPPLPFDPCVVQQRARCDGLAPAIRSFVSDNTVAARARAVAARESWRQRAEQVLALLEPVTPSKASA